MTLTRADLNYYHGNDQLTGGQYKPTHPHICTLSTHKHNPHTHTHHMTQLAHATYTTHIHTQTLFKLHLATILATTVGGPPPLTLANLLV